MINRVVACGDGLHGEHRESLNLVVIPGVIAVGSLVRHLVGVDVTLKDDLAVRGHHQVVVAADVGDALGKVGFFASQQSCKSVLGQGIRHRGDGP